MMSYLGGLRISLLVSGILAAPVWAVGEAKRADTSQPALPSLVIPEVESGLGDSTSTTRTSPHREIIESLLSKYLREDMEEDHSRISALVSGEYLSEYIRADGDPVRFSNEAFRRVEKDEPVEPPAPDPESAGVMSFIMSPAGIRALSTMSREQIEAVALIAELMQNPDAELSLTQRIPEVPGLGHQDLADMSPSELMRAVSNRETPRVVDVGDGRNMALASWYAGIDPEGVVYVENDHLPGSRLDVAEGMIFGEFGEVTNVTVDGLNAVVTFTTGDEIRSRPSSPRLAGVPDLHDEDVDLGAGEIIVSVAAPVGPPEASGKMIEEAAVASSLRPVARPAQDTRVTDESIKSDKSLDAGERHTGDVAKSDVRNSADIEAGADPMPNPDRLSAPSRRAPDIGKTAKMKT